MRTRGLDLRSPTTTGPEAHSLRVGTRRNCQAISGEQLGQPRELAHWADRLRTDRPCAVRLARAGAEPKAGTREPKHPSDQVLGSFAKTPGGPNSRTSANPRRA